MRDSHDIKDPAQLLYIPNISALRKSMKPFEEPPDLSMMAPERMTSLREFCGVALRLSSALVVGVAIFRL